ncbi:ABC transporter permease [Variovorax sp. Varisp62]|uniref:ABC transporter permease n=1 Tax=Variovorax sp. Varisp62 TaxID=3243049 RepID=UPI0039B50FCF
MTRLLRHPVTGTILSLAVFVGIWWAAAVLLQLPSYLLPTPPTVLERVVFLANNADLGTHMAVSAIELLAGFCAGAILGALTSSWFAHMPLAERLLSPLIVLVQTAPKIALAPLLVLWLGFGISSKVMLVGVVVFLPVIASTLAAIRSIPSTVSDLTQVLDLSAASRFFHVELPYALAGTLAGMRIGATQAITAIVIGELLGASAGLGVLLAMGLENSDAAIVLAVIGLLCLLGSALYAAVVWCESYLLRWHPSRQGPAFSSEANH